jgi:hypothetical protein
MESPTIFWPGRATGRWPEFPERMWSEFSEPAALPDLPVSRGSPVPWIHERARGDLGRPWRIHHREFGEIGEAMAGRAHVYSVRRLAVRLRHSGADGQRAGTGHPDRQATWCCEALVDSGVLLPRSRPRRPAEHRLERACHPRSSSLNSQTSLLMNSPRSPTGAQPSLISPCRAAALFLGFTRELGEISGDLGGFITGSSGRSGRRWLGARTSTAFGGWPSACVIPARTVSARGQGTGSTRDRGAAGRLSTRCPAPAQPPTAARRTPPGARVPRVHPP